MQDYLGHSLYLPVIWLETGILSPKVQVDGLPLWGVFTRSPQHTNKCKEKERDIYRGTYFYFIIVQLLIFTIEDTARLPLLWFLMRCFQKLQQNNSTSKNGPYYLNPEKKSKDHKCSHVWCHATIVVFWNRLVRTFTLRLLCTCTLYLEDTKIRLKELFLNVYILNTKDS